MDEKTLKRLLIAIVFYVGMACISVGAFIYDTIVGWCITGFLLIALAMAAHSNEDDDSNMPA